MTTLWDEYINAVIAEEIITGKLVRKAVERHIRDIETAEKRGLFFDVEAAQRRIDFNKFLKHYKGKWAGEEFVLSPWQAFIQASIFGWKQWDEEEQEWLRRFRYAYIQVARKNGKTTDAAAVGLYLMIADNEPGAEIYSAATARHQAKIVHTDAKMMVENSPELKKFIEVYQHNLNCPRLCSKFETVCSEDKKIDGLNPQCGIVDEYHAHSSSGVKDKLETGMGSRRQPLLYIITTAGNDTNSACYEEYDYCKKMLNGIIDNDNYFAFIAEVDVKKEGDESDGEKGDDWKDEKTWIKANPNLGISKSLRIMREHAEKAKKLPSQINTFRQLHLNLWVQQTERWIDMDLWNNQSESWGGNSDNHLAIEDQYSGQVAFGGLDMGSTSDFNAFVLAVPDGENLIIFCRFWCNENWIYCEENKYSNQYQGWVNQGFLIPTPGNASDKNAIYNQIMDDSEKFDLQRITLDHQFQGIEFAQNLDQELMGVEVVPMRQNCSTYGPLVKEFETRLLNKQIKHGGNPILKFCADNVTLYRNRQGDGMPDRKESRTQKIDGIVALLMAMDGVIRYYGTPDPVMELV